MILSTIGRGRVQVATFYDINTYWTDLWSVNILRWILCQECQHFWVLSSKCYLSVSVTFLYNFFGRRKSFLWGHWYPCFGLLVTSPLGFKASSRFQSRSGQLYLHLVEANFLAASMVGKLFSSTYLQAGISGTRNLDLLCRHYLTMWDQADALPTELCRLGFCICHFSMTAPPTLIQLHAIDK